VYTLEDVLYIHNRDKAHPKENLFSVPFDKQNTLHIQG